MAGPGACSGPSMQRRGCRRSHQRRGLRVKQGACIARCSPPGSVRSILMAGTAGSGFRQSEGPGGAPVGPVEQHAGMAAHGQCMADGAEQIGVLVALILGLAWPCAIRGHWRTMPFFCPSRISSCQNNSTLVSADGSAACAPRIKRKFFLLTATSPHPALEVAVGRSLTPRCVRLSPCAFRKSIRARSASTSIPLRC